jgi:hypothetical protein
MPEDTANDREEDTHSGQPRQVQQPEPAPAPRSRASMRLSR